MRFQSLAVVLGKMRWPELIAHERKKDLGLDAYAAPGLTREGIGKGLAASITPRLNKIATDAQTAKRSFPGLRSLLFVTPGKVGNADRKRWERTLQDDCGVELYIIEREEIITLLMMPAHASLRASFLHLDTESEPQIADLIGKTKRAAGLVARTWASKTKGHPLIDLSAVRLDTNGAESADVLSCDQISQALSQSRRIVLEGAAGRGKTTTLIQLAQRPRLAGTPFIVELSAWTSSRRGILEFVAGMPAFQAERLTPADLARVQQAEPFLLLLNGWNEISESNSQQATDALRELERDFPSAGIIVATRTHHLTPPLPGAMRLRLLPLGRTQRSAYLKDRLGAQGAELRDRIHADASLDEVTRTPLILSEVTSLFEAGAEIPSTKIGILTQVHHLQEQRDEHRNALQATPTFGRQTDYLKALAIEMTRRSAVELPEADARVITAAVIRKLTDSGQIEQVGAPGILATLTAHHVLERVDYPQPAFRFEHQQFQEYYAALDVRARLRDLQEGDHNLIGRFTADFVNLPAWGEPLRMIAESFAQKGGDADQESTSAGARLVEMALQVDPVFAGELAQLCGAAVWNSVRTVVGERFREIYTIHDGGFRQYALAAMLATGTDDFGDIIVPLLSGPDRQTRLGMYRLWPALKVSSLGQNWRKEVRKWNENARADFVSELLHNLFDEEVAAFAEEDVSIAVKTAAVSSLMWTGAEDALSRVLESMEPQIFEDFARNNSNRMPATLRTRTIAAMRKVVANTSDHSVRLRMALDLIELGETGFDDTVKNALAALPRGELRGIAPNRVQAAVYQIRKTDPVWVSEWVASQIAEGVLGEHEFWLPSVTTFPQQLVEKHLKRVETEDLRNVRIEGIIALITAHADGPLAARVFSRLRELRRRVDAEPGRQHELEWQVMHQLGAVFRCLPGNVAAVGVLASVTSGEPLDAKVAADLFSGVARQDPERMRIVDEQLRARLRAYFTSSVDLVLRQDDFNGGEKANLASSIAHVGLPEDMAYLVMLIRADIERMRRGRAGLLNGDRGPLGNGARMSYARWHIAALMHLDRASADQILIDLLPEPEYMADVAAAMAQDYLRTPEHALDRTVRLEDIWAARERHDPHPLDDRRTRFAAALNAEIRRLRGLAEDGKPVGGLKLLATALAAVEARGSGAAVIDAIAMPGQWDQSVCLDAAERLLMAGVVLPATAIFALLDSVLDRTKKWMPDQDSYLLQRALVLCPFVDDPVAGIARMRDVLAQRRLWGSELRDLITALGESRSVAAVDLLHELASDAPTFERCADRFFNAFYALDSPRACELLMAFIDPELGGIVPGPNPHREDVLVARVIDLARRRQEVYSRLRGLCERDLPERNRQILSTVMHGLGTPEALAANLNLIDDTRPAPVPHGIWDQLEAAFVERRPYGQSPNVFTQHSRASNDLRARLFEMAIGDRKRRRSAFLLLGRIEEWRLQYGRPVGEPRHPRLTVGQAWPFKEAPSD